MTYDFSNLPRELANGIQSWMDGADGVSEGIYRTVSDYSPDVVFHEENGVSVAHLVWRQATLAECQARLVAMAMRGKREVEALTAKLAVKSEDLAALEAWCRTVEHAED